MSGKTRSRIEKSKLLTLVDLITQIDIVWNIAGLIVILAAPLAGAMRLLAKGHDFGATVLIAVAFIAGTALGKTAVHRVWSDYVVRRLTEIETTSLDISVRFEGKSRVPVEWKQTRTVKALEETVSEVDIHFGYGAGTHLVRPTVPSHQGQIGDIIDQNGSWYAQLLFNSPLRRGESREFDIEFHVPAWAPDSPAHCGITPGHLTRNVRLTAIFGDDRPRVPWESYRVSSTAKTANQTRELQVVDRTVQHSLIRRTRPGQVWAIEWNWEDMV